VAGNDGQSIHETARSVLVYREKGIPVGPELRIPFSVPGSTSCPLLVEGSETSRIKQVAAQRSALRPWNASAPVSARDRLSRGRTLGPSGCGVKSRTLCGHGTASQYNANSDHPLGHRRIARHELGRCPRRDVQLAQAKLVSRAAGQSGSGPGAGVSPATDNSATWDGG
jgi:hypothetical protein